MSLTKHDTLKINPTAVERSDEEKDSVSRRVIAEKFIEFRIKDMYNINEARNGDYSTVFVM